MVALPFPLPSLVPQLLVNYTDWLRACQRACHGGTVNKHCACKHCAKRFQHVLWVCIVLVLCLRLVLGWYWYCYSLFEHQDVTMLLAGFCVWLGFVCVCTDI